MKLVWSAKASKRRDEIFDYIALDNPRTALWLDEQFSLGAKRVGEFPLSGRKGRVSGTRETIVHENYILVYEVQVDTIVILTVHHAAQQYPPE